LKPTNEFTKEDFEKVQLQLNQLVLLIYNAKVKQLVDGRGCEYFSYLGQKTQMEVANDQELVDGRGCEYFSYLGQKTQMEAAIDQELVDGRGMCSKYQIKVSCCPCIWF
jgi:hypothetical protein